MHRKWILVPIALLALAASACGGAPSPDVQTPEGAPRGDAECVTPPGATAENPGCSADCEWKAETSKCEPKRGIIVEDQNPSPPPPPPPTE